jgi:hypothetical protein
MPFKNLVEGRGGGGRRRRSGRSGEEEEEGGGGGEGEEEEEGEEGEGGGPSAIFNAQILGDVNVDVGMSAKLLKRSFLKN